MVSLTVHAFVTFLVTIGPLDVASIFGALSADAQAAERRRMAVRGTVIAAVILLLFALVGEALLQSLGISLPAFRVGGGILLMLLAIDMVFARHSGISGLTTPEDEEAVHRQDVSVFPLAVPLIAGPGAIASTILLMGQAEGNLLHQAAVLAMLLVVLASTLLALLATGPIMRLFGVTGVNVITRVLGIILAALAAQYIIDGIRHSGLVG